MDDPQNFWSNTASNIFWKTKFENVLDCTSPPFFRWFPDGTTNLCYNALDRHVEQGKDDHLALIYDSPVTNTIRRL